MTTLVSRRIGRRAAHQAAHRAAFASLLALGVILVLVETRGLSFFGDDWDFIVNRRGMGAAALLEPHGPHLSLIPILIYKVLLHLFGGAYLPFRLLAAFDVVVLAGVLGWFTRRAWGPWWGLVPVAILVTLGPGGDSLLWSFQCGYAIATALGAVALEAARRRTRNGDIVACAALVVALASASQGIGFTAGVALLLLLTGNWKRRSWVVLIPAVLYLAWYAKYGHQASQTSLSVWPGALGYEYQSLAATLPNLVGLGGVDPLTGLLDISTGIPLAVIVLLALGFKIWHGWRPPAIFWAFALTAVVLWLAAALSNTPIIPRPPTTARYLGTNAFIVLACFAAALPRPPRVTRQVAAAAVVALIVVGATNANQFHFARGTMTASDVASRAALGALSLMRGIVPPGFSPATTVQPAVLINVDAQTFFSAQDSFRGLPIDTPKELQAQDEPTREVVDADLARGEITLTPGSPPPGARACLKVTKPAALITLSSGSDWLRATAGPLTVTTGRFSSSNSSVPIGTVKAGQTADLHITRDADPAVPWRVLVTGAGSEICRPHD